MSQIVYVLTNESMPEYVKIGFTKRSVEKRIEKRSRSKFLIMSNSLQV
jgi:hypothetical protein